MKPQICRLINNLLGISIFRSHQCLCRFFRNFLEYFILPAMKHDDGQRTGIAYGLAAYGWWGFVPLYFKAVSHVAPLEVLAHRVLWSLVLLASLLAVRGRITSGAGSPGAEYEAAE